MTALFASALSFYLAWQIALRNPDHEVPGILCGAFLILTLITIAAGLFKVLG